MTTPNDSYYETIKGIEDSMSLAFQQAQTVRTATGLYFLVDFISNRREVVTLLVREAKLPEWKSGELAFVVYTMSDTERSSGNEICIPEDEDWRYAAAKYIEKWNLI